MALGVRVTLRGWERILLFLSVALMESLDIHVKICIEPEYADVDGFVLLPGKPRDYRDLSPG